jgi:hypothetical protein
MGIFRSLTISGFRGRSRFSGAAAWLGVALPLLLAVGEAQSAPKYFVKIRETELAAGLDGKLPQDPAGTTATAQAGDRTADGKPDGGTSASGQAMTPAATPTESPIAGMVKSVLTESLRKQADVTLELESPLTNAEAVKAECKRKGLRSFEFAVRVLRLDRGVKPPAAGKRFRILEQNVKLSVVGTTFPEGLLAVGGDGESTIQIEIGERVTPGQEREVLEEAVKDAVEQAVKQGMLKLSKPLGKPTNEKRKRK